MTSDLIPSILKHSRAAWAWPCKNCYMASALHEEFDFDALEFHQFMLKKCTNKLNKKYNDNTFFYFITIPKHDVVIKKRLTIFLWYTPLFLTYIKHCNMHSLKTVRAQLRRCRLIKLISRIKHISM